MPATSAARRCSSGCGRWRRCAPCGATSIRRAGQQRLPETAVVEAGALRLWVLHDISELDLDPVAAGFAAVVFGHSHKPSIEMRGGALYFNPGSAGPRRFKLPVTVGRLRIAAGSIRPEIVALDV